MGEIEHCEKPVICVMHGISYGLAIDMSTCADVRICTKDVRFAVKEVDIGLAADVGSLARLPRVVGSASWVKDVCFSAREFGAEEALRVGFVSAVYEGKDAAVEAAVKMATLWASKSPVAVQGTKELLNHARDHSVQESEFPLVCIVELGCGESAWLTVLVMLQIYDIRALGTPPWSSRTMSRWRCFLDSRGRSRSLRSCRSDVFHVLVIPIAKPSASQEEPMTQLRRNALLFTMLPCCS